MKFQRVYPVKIWIRGKSYKEKELREYCKIDKPDFYIESVEEVEELHGEEGFSVYQVTGFSFNPPMR